MAGVFKRERIRAAIGLIAAYAIALQAIFAALTPLPANAAGVDFGQILCFGSGNATTPGPDDGSAPPPAAGKLHCVLCVASAAAAILPEPAPLQAARSAIASAFPVANASVNAPRPAARSGPSRAPPLTM